eukprot:Sspe_Gene.110345::Locus_90951_Transcript_3_4_Confidence_0.400_Length_423::g.110345::m.110345
MLPPPPEESHEGFPEIIDPLPGAPVWAIKPSIRWFLILVWVGSRCPIRWLSEDLWKVVYSFGLGWICCHPSFKVEEEGSVVRVGDSFHAAISGLWNMPVRLVQDE